MQLTRPLPAGIVKLNKFVEPVPPIAKVTTASAPELFTKEIQHSSKSVAAAVWIVFAEPEVVALIGMPIPDVDPLSIIF